MAGAILWRTTPIPAFPLRGGRRQVTAHYSLPLLRGRVRVGVNTQGGQVLSSREPPSQPSPCEEEGEK